MAGFAAPPSPAKTPRTRKTGGIAVGSRGLPGPRNLPHKRCGSWQCARAPGWKKLVQPPVERNRRNAGINQREKDSTPKRSAHLRETQVYACTCTCTCFRHEEHAHLGKARTNSSINACRQTRPVVHQNQTIYGCCDSRSNGYG